MDKHDSEDTESVESKKRHHLHKEFLKKSGSYFINYVYIVLFLEKEPKHPLVKFCAAITLLIIICLGVWQVVEARKSNDLANESLRISAESLDLSNRSLMISNKMAAYSILSNPDTSNEAYVSSYNLLSSLEDSITYGINNKKINENTLIDFLGSGKSANVRFMESNVYGRYSKLESSYFGLYNSFLKLNLEESSYAAFGLYNSELYLIEHCDGALFLSDYDEKCSKSKGSMLDVKLRGIVTVSLENLHYSNIVIETLDSICNGYLDYFEPVDTELYECGGTLFKEVRGHKIIGRFVNIINSNDVVINNYIKSTPDEKNETNEIVFYFANSNNVVINDFGREKKRSIYVSSSSIKFNSESFGNSEVLINHNAHVVFEYVSPDEVDKVLKRNFLEEIAYNCANYINYLKRDLKSESDGFYIGFSCPYYGRHNKFMVPNNIEWHITKDKNKFVKYNDDIIDRYRNEFKSFFSIFEFPVKPDYERLALMKSSTILIGGDSGSLLIKGYDIRGTEFHVNSGFSSLKIKDSIVDESSKLFFDFSYGNDRDEVYCNKIKSLFTDVDNFKGTVIKRSNIKIIPEGACALDEELFK